MVTVIDNIRYHPRRSGQNLPQETDIMNAVYEQLAQQIRDRARRIATQGKPVTVTIKGTPRKDVKIELTVTGCDDDPKLLALIKRTLKP